MLQTFVIRRAEADDIPALQEIFDHETNLDKLERYSDEVLAAAMKNPSSLFLVATSGSILQGFIWLTGLRHPEIGVKVEEFASRSPRAGCGSYLFEHAMKTLLELQYSRIWLAVAADNEGAIRFYRKFGFVEKELRKLFWRRRTGDIADGLVMEVSASNLNEALSRSARTCVHDCARQSSRDA